MGAFVTSALLALLTNPTFWTAVLIPSATAGIAYALRKVPSQYINDSERAEAAHALEAGVHDTMDLALSLKSTNPDGQLTPTDIKKLQDTAIATAENILLQRGKELGKILQPELIKLTVDKAADALKGIKRLPLGTQSGIPLILFMLLPFFAGCATFPAGWETASVQNKTAVEEAVAGFIQRSSTSPVTVTARDIFVGASRTAFTVYIGERFGAQALNIGTDGTVRDANGNVLAAHKDRDVAEKDAYNAAMSWIKNAFAKELAGRTPHDYLLDTLQLPHAITDAELFIGILQYAVDTAKK